MNRCLPSSLRRSVVAVVALSASAIATEVFAHGTIVDSRVFRVRQAGPNANLMGAWTDSMYDWSANSQNFADYASPSFSYSQYVPDGTIASAGQNNGQNGHLNFTALNNAGAWPTTPATAGSLLSQTWTAPAPHDPSYFDVWITKQGFDVTTQTIGWSNLDKLGRWEANTALPVVTAPGSAPSPADGSLLTGYNWNVPIAADRSGRAALVVIWQRRDPVGEAFFSVQDIMISPSTPAGPTWTPAGGGNYHTATNWNGNTVPNGVGAIANFGGSITAASTITLNTAATLGTLRFANANSYTIAGTQMLMLENTNGNAIVDVSQGSHAINAGVMLHQSTNVSVAGGSTLSLGGALMFSSNNILTKSGAGTLRLNNSSVMGASNAMLVVDGGVLKVDAALSPSIGVHASGGEARFSSSQQLRSLTVAGSTGRVTLDSTPVQLFAVKTSSIGIGGGSTLDIGDNALIVDYTAGNSMLEAVTAAARTGELNNHAGAGLISSVAASNLKMRVGVVEASTIGSPATFLGTAIDSTSVLARYTFKGDTDLNGTVNFSDLLSLAQRYGQSGNWRTGDSNHDGTINFSDLLALAQNYNGSLGLSDATLADIGNTSFAADWALAVSLVPEPTSLAALLALSSVMTRRRCAPRA